MTDIIKQQIEQERELRRLRTSPRFAFADRELGKLFATLIQQFPFGTIEPEPEPQKPSKELVKLMRERDKVRRWNDTIQRQAPSETEQSYNQLDGEWREWLEVAKLYEHKVPKQDRGDMRHTIILELHRARQRDNKPLPLLRAYRIASLTVALYWREQAKAQTRVCVYSGEAREPHCRSCVHKPNSGKGCAWLALRPIQSLDSEVTDSEGNRVRLIDTVATESPLDLPDKWYDLTSWLLGCPTRLIDIANKKLEGKPLSSKDRMYLSRYRHREQKRLF